MGKAVPPPPAPDPTVLDIPMNAFLFTGDYKWMFYFTLVGFCAANAKAILAAAPKINYFHGCALMVLANYGGSTMAAIMCGQPVAFVTNEALVPCCLATWTVFYLLPDLTVSLIKDNPVGRHVTSACYEIMRCHVLMNCSKMAAATLTPGGRAALVGPLIAGTLGGCGGGFMPLNKGLDPLAGGLNWRIGSAALNSLWIFLSTQYATSKAMLDLSEAMARFLAVSFFVLVPVLEAVLGLPAVLGANPTLPKAPAATGKAKKA